MNELHLAWISLTVFVPLLGALWVARIRDREVARNWSVGVASLTLICSIGAWQDFHWLNVAEAWDPLDAVTGLMGKEFLVIDRLNAPLLPLAAILYLLTAIATLRTKVRRFSFAWTLVSESILLATLSCKNPWGIIALLAAGCVPPYLELKARHKPTGVYVSHAVLFIGMLLAGWAMVSTNGPQPEAGMLAISLLVCGVLIRGGIAPFHCWITDLFEHATFGTALLFVTPIVGAYAAVRLVLPIASEAVLHNIGLMSLVTAVYAAGMALVQKEARRFFCFLFLSHSSLVFVGLEAATPISLTGALCVWLSIGLSLAGFGLTLRALEARRGRLSLAEFHGVYEHAPMLAVCFLLTGLASVGFPGTFGFVATELLVDGAVQEYPYIGTAVVIAAAINGIAVVQAYFALFTGSRHTTSVSLRSRIRERLAVLTLAALILGGGLLPQPIVLSRHDAAIELLQGREDLATEVAVHPRRDLWQVW